MTTRRHSTFAAILILLALSLLPACGGGTRTFPSPPPPTHMEMLYATSANQVLAFNVNTTTGALGTPAMVAGPATSFRLLANPAGTFLYVSDTFKDRVNNYSINSTSGALAAVGTPAVVGAAPNTVESAAGLAMDPAGKFLFASDLFAADVAAFTASSSTGGLTAVAGSPFATSVGGGTIGSAPLQAVTDPTGSFLFVTDNADPLGGVSAYTINAMTGGLTLVAGSPFSSLIGGGAYGLAVHPAGKFLYVGDTNANKIVAFTINSGGTLTTVVGLPFPTGVSPVGLAIDPTGKFLYAANFGDGTISAFTIDPNAGGLTAVGAAVAVGTAPYGLAIDPGGKFLYVTSPQNGAAGTITGFGINSSTGALTKLSGQASAAGNGPLSLTVVAIP